VMVVVTVRGHHGVAGHGRVTVHAVEARVVGHGNSAAGIVMRVVVAAASGSAIAAVAERIVLMAQSAVAGRGHSVLIRRHGRQRSADGSADRQGFHHLHRIKRWMDHLSIHLTI
jgi:hypothetical protein